MNDENDEESGADNFADDHSTEVLGFLGGVGHRRNGYRAKQDEYRTLILSRRIKYFCKRFHLYYTVGITIFAIILLVYLIVGPNLFQQILNPFSNKNGNHLAGNLSDSNISISKVVNEALAIGHCRSLQLKEIWFKGFANLTSDSEVAFIDVNGDGTLDIILGFGTGQISN